MKNMKIGESKLVSAMKYNGTGDVDSEITYWLHHRPVYAVLEVTFEGEDPYKISGSVLQLKAWLDKHKTKEWFLTDFTTDRNEARKKAEEV